MLRTAWFILINVALFILHRIRSKKVFAGKSDGFVVQVKSTRLPTGARTLTGSGPWTRLAAVHYEDKNQCTTS